jgi:hypothetical protein
MHQSPASSHGHRNRNGAGRSNGPEPTPTSSLPPHTPRHSKPGVAIDKLILSLEDEWRLGLKIRGPLWSPQKADERSTAEKVYGQVQRLFYSDAPALGSALEIFRKEAPGFPHDKRLNLLHVLLKSKTHSPVSRADTPLNKAPKSLNSIQTSCKRPIASRLRIATLLACHWTRGYCTTVPLPALCDPTNYDCATFRLVTFGSIHLHESC